MATPEPEKKSIGAGESVPRYQTMKATGVIAVLPPNPLPYLIDWLFEIGPTVPAGMSAGAIGWSDISAWQGLTGIDLQPWEARLLRRLSGDFLAQLHKSKKPDCPAPWTANADIIVNREAVSRKVGNAFQALAMAQKKGRKRESRNP